MSNLERIEALAEIIRNARTQVIECNKRIDSCNEIAKNAPREKELMGAVSSLWIRSRQCSLVILQEAVAAYDDLAGELSDQKFAAQMADLEPS